MANLPPVSSSDPEALALLIALRDNPDNQRDPTLFKMFNNAIASITVSTNSSTATLISSPIPEIAPEPKTFPLVPFIQIDTSGQDGDNGHPGAAASHLAAKGLNGTDGAPGKNARDINLRLMRRDELLAAEWEHGSGSLKFVDGSASIVLRAAGGKGGRGGNGGSGGTGTQGTRGANATQISDGKNGERGGTGGTGGNSGNGSNGGSGGAVKVYVSPDDTDLLLLMNTPDVAGGVMGKAGAEGKGGIGGPGGPGGSSLTWSEMRTGTRTTYRNGHSHTETYTYTVSHFNPGGSRGSQGHAGQDGKTGSHGKTGLNGSFQVIVGEKVYQQIYDLTITVSKIIDLKGGSADFYEPGEQVHMLVAVHNTGGMPTPPCDIEISLQSTPGVQQDLSLLTLKPFERLPSGDSHTFSTPFSFRIHDLSPSVENPLHKQETLTFRAHVPRVNKSFHHVSQQKEVLTVKYPVEMTPLTGKTLTVFDEKTILSLFVHNRTSTEFGIESPQKRRIFVIFEITELETVKPNDVELVTAQLFSEKEMRQEQNKVIVEIDHLSSKNNERLDVSFRFTNPELKARSKVGVTASLYLEYIHSESGRVRCIQKRMIQIHLSESYRYNPMADMLLVTHSGITQEELEVWENLLKGMQLVYSIWNATYYNHVNFNQPLEKIQATLENHFVGKTVIILNQLMEGSASRKTVINQMPKGEIFRIGKNFNIKTYIVGEKITLKEQGELRRDDITNIAPQTLYGRVLLESSFPNEFENQVKEFVENLRKSHPIKKYVIVKKFDPQKADGMLKYALGTVKACPIGQLNRACVLSIPCSSTGPRMIESPQNRYGLLKMLHFERKLSLLGSIPRSSRQLLEDAILSDLADEQYVVGLYPWAKDATPVLKRSLEQLSIFATRDWQASDNDQLRASVRRILLQFRAFINTAFMTKDHSHPIAKASEELIDLGITTVFGIQDQWQKEYATYYYEPLSKFPHPDLWALIRNPRFNAFYQDNWDGLSQIKSFEELQ